MVSFDGLSMENLWLIWPRHELFLHFWKGQADFTGVVKSPLIAFMKDFKFSESEARGFKWDFKVDELTLMGYIGQVVAWMRLTWLQEPEGGFDGLGYWAKKVLLFDSGPEAWYVQQATKSVRDQC
jgi:hypothetical protein